jgi:serine protease Do
MAKSFNFSDSSIMKYLLLLTLLFSPFFSLSCFSQSLPDLYDQLHTSVVVIKISKANTVSGVDESGKSMVSTINDEGEGSGILISKNLILTAAHVVHGADELNIIFYDGKAIAGKVISSDVSADLSLVKLDSEHPSYKPAKLGNSDKVRIGESIFVIGAPYNISYTLTRGVISGRHIQGSEKDFYKSEFFQTDASLNPGNSGGPLFNMQGEVIGIASFIKSKSGGNEGLGFAVTINSAKQLMLERSAFYSGIDVTIINGLLVDALNIPQKSALIIKKVAKGSIAHELGLKGGTIPIKYANKNLSIGGDVILSINNILTDSKQNLLQIETILRDKKEFTLTFLRKGKIKTIIWKKNKESD